MLVRFFYHSRGQCGNDDAVLCCMSFFEGIYLGDTQWKDLVHFESNECSEVNEDQKKSSIMSHTLFDSCPSLVYISHLS